MDTTTHCHLIVSVYVFSLPTNLLFPLVCARAPAPTNTKDDSRKNCDISLHLTKMKKFCYRKSRSKVFQQRERDIYIYTHYGEIHHKLCCCISQTVWQLIYRFVESVISDSEAPPRDHLIYEFVPFSNNFVIIFTGTPQFHVPSQCAMEEEGE